MQNNTMGPPEMDPSLTQPVQQQNAWYTQMNWAGILDSLFSGTAMFTGQSYTPPPASGGGGPQAPAQAKDYTMYWILGLVASLLLGTLIYLALKKK